ncbi:ketopantoate reductase family protein [Legionella nagasakiensis]|uniref:ketopantoate reductase family protein n=1 Tax=Legionella nagasakiensis TaxID=535290 RepID=UPI001055D989|nr:2-dehydropantoate 2-reductase [Legionella nagasakiensis]
MTVTEQDPIWHIAGIGALGSVVAGCFHQTGVDVRLILKNEQQLSIYQQSELTILKAHSVFTACPEATVLDHLGDEPIDYLLCCVKAYDITGLLMRLKQNLHPNSIIILIHNGLGVLDEIKTSLPQSRVILGISTIGAYQESAFAVRAFLGGKFYLGQAIGQYTPKEIKSVCATFAKAKLPYQWVGNIQPILWEKFAINCCINLLTALFKCKNGDLLFHKEILKNLSCEVTQVIRVYGMDLSAEELFHKVISVIESTTDNYSSMYKDIENNKQTEIYYLNEHLVKLAQQKKMRIPVHSELLNKFYSKFHEQKFHGSNLEHG